MDLCGRTADEFYTFKGPGQRALLRVLSLKARMGTIFMERPSAFYVADGGWMAKTETCFSGSFSIGDTLGMERRRPWNARGAWALGGCGGGTQRACVE